MQKLIDTAFRLTMEELKENCSGAIAVKEEEFFERLDVLEQSLNSEQKKLLNEVASCFSFVSDEERKLMFEKGYRKGAKHILELLGQEK